MSKIALEELPIARNNSQDVNDPEVPSDGLKSEFDAIQIHRPVTAKWRLIVILSCLSTGLFLSLMDMAIVSPALYTISVEFGNFRNSSWVILAYTMSDVGCAVIITRLADALGRKLVVICSFAVFATSSLACGWSRSMYHLIAFRALQGAGGAGLYSMTMVIFPEVSPPSMTPLISTILGAIIAVAGVTGPILGGILTTDASWRWIFWLNGPCAIIPMVIIAVVWPKNFHAPNASSPPLRRLDFLGGILMVSGSVLLVFTLFQGAARTYAWKSAPVVVIFTIAGCCWIGLVAWEWALSRHRQLKKIIPHLPFRLMTDRVMVAGFISNFLTGFVFLLTVVNVPLRAQIVDVDTAMKAGLQLLPLVGGSALGSAIGGGASSKKNLSYYTLNLASALRILGCGLLSTLPTSGVHSKAQIGYEFILGLGVGMSFATMVLMTSLHVQFVDHAVAQGITAQLRVFGGSIGVAASMIILNNDIGSALSSFLSASQLADFYNSPIAILSFTPIQQYHVRETFILTFNKDMRLCMYVSAVCLLVTLCTYQKKPVTLKERIAELEAVYVRTEMMDHAGGEI